MYVYSYTKGFSTKSIYHLESSFFFTTIKKTPNVINNLKSNSKSFRIFAGPCSAFIREYSITTYSSYEPHLLHSIYCIGSLTEKWLHSFAIAGSFILRPWRLLNTFNMADYHTCLAQLQTYGRNSNKYSLEE